MRITGGGERHVKTIMARLSGVDHIGVIAPAGSNLVCIQPQLFSHQSAMVLLGRECEDALAGATAGLDGWTFDDDVDGSMDASAHGDNDALKLAVGDGLAAGDVIAFHAPDTPISYAHYRFWMRSSADADAGDYQFAIFSDDGTTVVASANIPALSADEWMLVDIEIDPKTVHSFGIKAVKDPGEVDLWLDGIIGTRAIPDLAQNEMALGHTDFGSGECIPGRWINFRLVDSDGAFLVGGANDRIMLSFMTNVAGRLAGPSGN